MKLLRSSLHIWIKNVRVTLLKFHFLLPQISATKYRGSYCCKTSLILGGSFLKSFNQKLLFYCDCCCQFSYFAITICANKYHFSNAKITMVTILQVKKMYQSLIFLNRDLNLSIVNISQMLKFQWHCDI